MRRRRTPSRRGFTLVESIVVVVVVALLVPPAVSMLREAQVARVDSANAVRASVLCGAVLEQVLADASSPAPSLGMAAFSNSATYLDRPVTGLKARLSSVTSAYSTLGVSWSLTIGGPVSAGGTADANAALNIYRAVTVTASWNSGRVGRQNYAVTAIVTDLTP